MVLDVMAQLTENNLADWMEIQKALMREAYLVVMSGETMESKKACLLDLLKARHSERLLDDLTAMQMAWLRVRNSVCSSDEMSASMRELMLASMFLLPFLGESAQEQLVLRHVHVEAYEVYPIHYAAAAHSMPMPLKEVEDEG